jgi:hypothetical protein
MWIASGGLHSRKAAGCLPVVAAAPAIGVKFLPEESRPQAPENSLQTARA